MRTIAVIGLGYVGLPLVAALARKFPGTIGFDVDAAKVERLRRGSDPTGAVSADELAGCSARFEFGVEALREVTLYIVAVPTPIDEHRRPDLRALRAASRTVGSVLKRGDVVVFESTVYPGVTEEICGPLLAEASGLRCGEDFKLGYSPERVNPGDREHTLERVVKVIAAQDEEALGVLRECYGTVVEAGVFEAASIQVAEAAKVIENVQRDLNIALMNELSIIFDRLGIDTQHVLDAAATKWNFHRYHPGLVGGHCIGVDPYYLTTRAESVGIHPQVILAGRRINDGMGVYVAARTVKLLIEARRRVSGSRVALLGLAFKANVPDTRNSRVPDIAAELADYGVEVLPHDPLVEAREVFDEYGLELVGRGELERLDAVVLATPHDELRRTALELAGDIAAGGDGGVLVDVGGVLAAGDVPPGIRTWRL